MSGSRISQGFLSGLLFTAALLADEPAATVPTATEAAPPPTSVTASRLMRLHLMEGSVVTGKLSTETVVIETSYGKLSIPVNDVVSFTPGLDSHPVERKKIGRLIQELGSNAAAERDSAQKLLAEMGKTIQPELSRYSADEDTERRTRVQKILAEMEEQDDDDDFDSGAVRPWVAQDTLETREFTVVGKISPQVFEVQTQFGSLKIAIGDIRRAEREAEQKPEIRKVVSVGGEHLVQLNMVGAGVRLNPGDKVQITAEGKLTMSPWGNNMFSTPEGSEQFQWYLPNQIPGGALVGRIGTTGPVFKVGSKHTLTAQRGGMLYLGIAMSPQFATSDFAFPGSYKVKLRVNAR